MVVQDETAPPTRVAAVREPDWPEVDWFTDHWSWRPDWTAQRPRLLWYLTFETVPELHRLAEGAAPGLRAAGADAIPTRWLHLTLSDVGFADEVPPSTRSAAVAAAAGLLRDEPCLDLTLGPVALLPGAVVLPARPAQPLARIRDAVREASAGAGIDLSDGLDDLDGQFWPHVSLCYVNRWTERDALRAAVLSIGQASVDLRCERLAQVLVTRRQGHYRWNVLDEVDLVPGPRPPAPSREDSRAR